MTKPVASPPQADVPEAPAAPAMPNLPAGQPPAGQPSNPDKMLFENGRIPDAVQPDEEAVRASLQAPRCFVSRSRTSTSNRTTRRRANARSLISMTRRAPRARKPPAGKCLRPLTAATTSSAWPPWGWPRKALPREKRRTPCSRRFGPKRYCRRTPPGTFGRKTSTAKPSIFDGSAGGLVNIR
jgi:hypothetical protein